MLARTYDAGQRNSTQCTNCIGHIQSGNEQIQVTPGIPIRKALIIAQHTGTHALRREMLKQQSQKLAKSEGRPAGNRRTNSFLYINLHQAQFVEIVKHGDFARLT